MRFKVIRFQSLVEYVLLIALISLFVVGIVKELGGTQKDNVSQVSNAMNKSVKKSDEETLDNKNNKNNKNIKKYKSGTMTGVTNNIKPPPTTGGSTGNGGFKNTDAPVENKLPVANFNWQPEKPQPGKEIKFLNLSTDPDGDRIVEEEWIGKITKYPPGEHLVKLRVADEKGNWSDWCEKTVLVENLPPVKPIITMSPDGKLDASTNITFEAETSDPNDDEFTLEWKNKKSSYPEGEHTVEVRGIDSWGLEGEWGKLTFKVENGFPTTPKLICTPNKGNLYVETLITCVASDSTDPDGDAIEYEYVNLSETKKYPIGTTVVKARAVDSKGNAGNYAETEVVIGNRRPSNPLINVKILQQTMYHSIIDISAYGSVDPDGDVVTYKWEGKNEDNKYINGEHTIKVMAKDPHGAFSEWVEYKFSAESPLKNMFENWQNYIRNGGASGEWKYDASKNWIYSTQNVGWTGFYNPEDVVLKNYTISFDMAQTPKVSDDDNLGMTFRMKDLNNMYFLTFDNRTVNNGNIKSGLYKILNGKQTLLVDLMPMKWEPNVWDTFKIEARGNEIRVWKNGSLIVNYTDKTNPILDGAYGPFTVSQANGAFKNIVMDVIE